MVLAQVLLMLVTTVTAYWYGKNPASSLFGTGPSYGFSSQELMGWIEYGGGRASI